MNTTTIKYFAFAHLPPHLQTVSRPIGELAEKLEATLPNGPEKSVGMRKLLEAKDCFVRAQLDAPKVESLLQPHQQRVVDEKGELDARLAKLRTFIAGGFFADIDPAEQERLRSQEDVMSAYSEILGTRIEAFTAAA